MKPSKDLDEQIDTLLDNLYIWDSSAEGTTKIKASIDNLKQAIKQLIEEERELAIYSYRGDILADNYDSELGTYDFDGIAEKVVELGKDSFKRLAEYDGESKWTITK